MSTEVEVVSKTERKRRFTRSERAEALAEASRTSVAAVCRKMDISRSVIYAWRAKASRNTSSCDRELAPTFVRLSLASKDKTVGRRAIQAPACITLVIGPGLELSFPEKTDVFELARFVAALKSALT